MKGIDKRIKSYKLKNGLTRYQFQMYSGYDPITGKQKNTTRRGFKTIEEAELELSKLESEVDNEGIFKQKILDEKLKQIKYTFEELNKLSSRLDDNMILDIAYKLSNEVGLKKGD